MTSIERIVCSLPEACKTPLAYHPNLQLNECHTAFCSSSTRLICLLAGTSQYMSSSEELTLLIICPPFSLPTANPCPIQDSTCQLQKKQTAATAKVPRQLQPQRYPESGQAWGELTRACKSVSVTGAVRPFCVVRSVWGAVGVGGGRQGPTSQFQ